MPAGQATSNQRNHGQASGRSMSASRQLPRCSGSAFAARSSFHAITGGNAAYRAIHCQRSMCCDSARDDVRVKNQHGGNDTCGQKANRLMVLRHALGGKSKSGRW